MDKDKFNAYGELCVAKLALELAQTKHTFGLCTKGVVTDAWEKYEYAKRVYSRYED